MLHSSLDCCILYRVGTLQVLDKCFLNRLQLEMDILKVGNLSAYSITSTITTTQHIQSTYWVSVTILS